MRKRLSTEQFIAAFGKRVAPSPAKALPVVTFTEQITFHWNGDEVRVVHLAPAHTDGDAIIHFVGADVIHTGDTFFNGFYPFMDVSSGGRLDGMIAAAEQVLDMAGPETKIIPGHGPLATRNDLVAYRNMLGGVRTRVMLLVAKGLTVDEVIAAKEKEVMEI